MQYFMGIDIGTSSTRAVLFDENGTQVYLSSMECSIVTSLDGRVEIAPEPVFDSILSVIVKCINLSGINKNNIGGIGISCHMHSLLAVDKHGNPLTNLITWADTRAKKQAEYIENNYSINELYYKTGCRIQHPMYPLSKILWLKENDQDIYNKAYKFITFKEFIIFKLYGEFVTDYTLAACQGYYNIHTQKWDQEIIRDILGIDESRLSEVVECTFALKGLKKEYADILGLDKNIPLVIGSGDGIMANIGCGVYDDTSLSSTIGTSGAVRTAVSSPLLDPQQQTWCYSFTRDMWVAGGAINNGGIVLKWIREKFGKLFIDEAQANDISIYKILDNYASKIPAGCEGLMFLPHLTGERSPDWNANAKGLMFGLEYSHGIEHIVRAAMEGVMYRMYSIFEVMSRLKNNVNGIRANGGYVKSDVWLQIQADIFNKPILVSGVAEASALGAAYIAMLSTGAVSDIKQLLPGMKPQKVITPNEKNHETYAKAYSLSKQIYDNIYNLPEEA